MSNERPEVHLRMLTADDAPWLVQVDRESGALARSYRWEEGKLAAALDEGRWASDDRWGWAVVVDGTPGGFVLVTIADGDALMEIRLAVSVRGKGVGREVLRQLADHHFADAPSIRRLVGRTHEHNVPMQRAFNAAGFRMEARYRESYPVGDGRFASEWGYALTRADWEAERHRADDQGYDLHGLTFAVEDVVEGERRVASEIVFKFLQEGRRALARYAGGPIVEGEAAGILHDDVFTYRFVQETEARDGVEVATGGGRARIQRRQDGRLELVNDWSDDRGRHGKNFLVERR